MPSTAPKGSIDNAPSPAEQQYALVSRGAVVGLRGPTTVRPKDGDFSDEYPADSKWLPIVDIEKQTFDARTHARLVPCYEVNGDFVHRTYTLV